VLYSYLEYQRRIDVENIAFTFNRKKAIETILYLSNRVSEHDIYGICKLLYLADKISLENYGRFIFGETYCAMERGATPSNAYDLIKKRNISEFKINNYEIIPLRDADLSYFSKSDIYSLNKIIEQYGDKNWRARYKAAHDEAYWQAWDRRGNDESVDMPIDTIAKMFPDADDLIDYLVNCGAD
jgi:uncharacterized phage-associated protein